MENIILKSHEVNLLYKFKSVDNAKDINLDKIYYKIDKGVGKLIALDGRRMIIINTTLMPDLDGKIIDIFRIKRSDEMEISMINKKQVKFKVNEKFGGCYYRELQITDAKYYNYKKLLPKGKLIKIDKVRINFKLLPKNMTGIFNFYGEDKAMLVNNLEYDWDTKVDGIMLIMPMTIR